MPLCLFRPEDGPSECQSLSVADILDAYARHCAAEGVHGDGARDERHYVFRLFRADYGHLPVNDCRPFHLTDFIESHPEWKSVSTRRQKAGAIKACFRWAADGERIDRHPFRAVRYGESERRPEMADDVLSRIQALANKPGERVLRFIRLTGCRASEVCRAIWADVDLERGIWKIPKHKGRRYTGRAKVVALVAEAVELLRSIAAAKASTMAASPRSVGHMPALGMATNEADRIFLNTRGKPWTRHSIWQTIHHVKRRAGITAPGSTHSIRHRAASAMVVAGAPISLVAAQLGHANPTITSKYYVHLENQIDAIRAAASLGVPRTN